jgi:hypothetical protein
MQALVEQSATFLVRVGQNYRTITNYVREEGTVMVVPSLRNVEATVQYVTLKVDVSASMNHTKRATILHSFIRTTFENAIGTVYMKIVAFSGGESELTLTSVSVATKASVSTSPCSRTLSTTCKHLWTHGRRTILVRRLCTVPSRLPWPT